jgi:hypothetical protein
LSIHLEGYPNAVKVLALKGKQAKRLSDLVLHNADVDFGLQCLDALAALSEDQWVIKQALWRSAVIYAMKGYGDSGARFQLSSHKVLKGEPPEAMEVFNYFKSLRNKHFIHDENSYTQCPPGAILNPDGMSPKIVDIVCPITTAVTLVPDNVNNLRMLLSKTKEVVIQEFMELCNSFKDSLEAMPYESLYKMEPPTYKTPVNLEIHAKRQTL